jgi:hypothetical protein
MMLLSTSRSYVGKIYAIARQSQEAPVPRTRWTGHLGISLITIPIRLYRAVPDAKRVQLQTLHAGCHERLHQEYVCPTRGKVERDEITKGYTSARCLLLARLLCRFLAAK